MSNTFRTLLPIQVETKVNWADPWIVRSRVIPQNCSLAANAVGQFQFQVPYGVIKFHDEAGFSPKDFTQIQRDWVRVKRAPYTNSDVIFLGRVESDSRDLYAPAGVVSQGNQTFTAYDGVQLMNKRMVSRSVFQSMNSGLYKESHVLIPFNLHPNGRDKVKNRSNNPRSSGGFPHFVFLQNGAFWTVADAIYYVIAEFMNDGSGPMFSVNIPAGSLSEEMEPLAFRKPSLSVIEMLDVILSKYFGWGWACIPQSAGYELRFFSLTASTISYGTVSVPANTNAVSISTSNPDAQIQIERSQVTNYGKLRVISRPMIVCRSFNWEENQINKGWTTEDEGDFTAASESQKTSGDFDTVYQRFYAKITDSAWTASQLPKIKPDGTLDLLAVGPIPQLTKSTLEATPLYTGIDYQSFNPLDVTEDLQFRGPRLWMKRKGVTANEYVDAVEETGCSLYTLPTFIGLQARVNDPRVFTNQLDYEKSVFTVAFEAAERLSFEYAIPGASDADGVFEIEVPDAELWYLSESTMLGLNSDGTPKLTTSGQTLRNDREKCFRAMAGLIARYGNPRARASITFKGVHPYHFNLGHILATVADSSDANEIGAPITSVRWTFNPDFSTVLNTGYSVQ